MLRVLHLLLVGVYLVLPVVALGLAIRHGRRTGRAGPLVGFMLAVVLACLLGVPYLYQTAWVMKFNPDEAAVVPFGEGALFVYFLLSAMCLLRLVDRALMRGVMGVLRVRFDRKSGEPQRGQAGRALLGMLAQRLALLAVGLPYFLTMMAVYRPKVSSVGDPQSVLKLAYEPLAFESAGGADLAGWWVPAAARPADVQPEWGERWGRETVVICHGLASGKARQLKLIRALAVGGFNVLAFDFRAHGGSAGHLTSFGDDERRDVLGAVRWVRLNRPEQARRVHGIGMNSGAAALVAAAADGGEEGQSIASVALIEPYADLGELARVTADVAFPRPLDWVVHRVGLPVASLHVGRDLASFRPAGLVAGLWPRPVLVVHGRGESFVPVVEGMEVYRRAMQPKEDFWPADNYAAGRQERAQRYRRGFVTEVMREWLGLNERVGDDVGVQRRVMQFFREAEALQVL